MSPKLIAELIYGLVEANHKFKTPLLYNNLKDVYSVTSALDSTVSSNSKI